MIRAQIYLTSTERDALQMLAQNTGKFQSELIREAVDQLIEHYLIQKQDKLSILRATKRLWADRNDLPDFPALRKELDRPKKAKNLC